MHLCEYRVHSENNGGGICVICGGYNHEAFTAAELGRLCAVCGEPSFLDTPTGYVCPEHHPGKEFLDRANAMKASGRKYDEHGNTWAMLIYAYGLAQEGKEAKTSLRP